MATDPARMEELSSPFSTKSDKIRALNQSGYSRSEIAKFLGVRYQFVRNVLVGSAPKSGENLRKQSGAEGIRNRMRLKVDAGGRVPIPMSVRQAMAIGEDNIVLAWLEDGELHMVSPRMALRQAQRLAHELIGGKDSLADELVSERRQEVRRERKNG